MAEPVSVAIPVLNGRPLLDEVLKAVSEQDVDRPVELLVADSGSTDGSRELARGCDATIIDIRRDCFSHGHTRHLLSRRASGKHIAFLTQDAVPASSNWLANLLEGFGAASDVALVFGPYAPRRDSSAAERRELDAWFRSLSPDGTPRVDRGLPSRPDADGLRRLFFSDANACIARSALDEVPFRPVSYAEDQLLARDMLAAGYAKVFRPDAPVVHSHDYGPLDRFRRAFDEWRALREVHGVIAGPGLAGSALIVQRRVRDDLSAVRGQGSRGAGLIAELFDSATHHTARAAGAWLGARADGIPPSLRALCSLERRPGFEPVSQRGEAST